MFEQYLMFAAIFGIAKKVQKDFEKLYPNMLQEYSGNYSYSDIIFIHSFAHIGVSSAQSRANAYSGRWRRIFFRRPAVAVHLEEAAGGRWLSLKNDRYSS